MATMTKYEADPFIISSARVSFSGPSSHCSRYSKDSRVNFVEIIINVRRAFVYTVTRIPRVLRLKFVS